jgi:hypothetical protein
MSWRMASNSGMSTNINLKKRIINFNGYIVFHHLKDTDEFIYFYLFGLRLFDLSLFDLSLRCLPRANPGLLKTDIRLDRTLFEKNLKIRCPPYDREYGKENR